MTEVIRSAAAESAFLPAAGLSGVVFDRNEVRAAAVALVFRLAEAAPANSDIEKVGSEFCDSMDEDTANAVCRMALGIMTTELVQGLLSVIHVTDQSLSEHITGQWPEWRDAVASEFGGGR